MSDALYAAQQAVNAALVGSFEVQSVLGNPARIYDHLPPGATFPYVVFGASHIAPYDTKTETGFEHILTLEIWSRYRGSKEAKDVFQALYDTLHRANLSVSGQVFLSCEFHSADFTSDSVGETYQASARFSVITQNS